MFPELRQFLRELILRLLNGKNKEPPTEPSLVITSKPVPVRDIWGKPSRRKSFLSSLAVHTVIISLLLAGFGPSVRRAVKAPTAISTTAIDISPYLPQRSGGGGGGDRSPSPASKGKLPCRAEEQFTPPQVVIRNLSPKLAMEPTVIAPPDIAVPSVMPQLGLGDPFSRVIGPPSSGPGSGSGIGTGSGGGVGPGKGLGVGPGSGGGFGGGVFSGSSSGVILPKLLYKVEPDYSEEARKARYQGTVLLYAEIDTEGKAQNVRVVRSVGLGLDERAIEAIKQWKFSPALKDSKPVRFAVSIEVTFRLL